MNPTLDEAREQPPPVEEPACLFEARPGCTSVAPIPSTPHQAYRCGWDASHRGDDLVTVIDAALRTWPLDEGLGELAELIVCASLGYWTEGGGQ
jgi:hypothetical protein